MPLFGLQRVIVYFLVILTYFFVFDQATRLENLVQLFNAESHANGIKPVHGIDDAIAKYVFDKFVEKNRYAYVPDNMTKNYSKAKSNSGYKNIHMTLHRDDGLAAQF